MAIDHNQIDWVYVERALEEGTYSGYKFAVIECDKILQKVLQKKYPYIRNIDESQKKLSTGTKFPAKLKYISAMYHKITTEPGFDVSAEDTKNIISGYYKIINELTQQEIAPSTTQAKVQNYLHKLLHENIYTRYFIFLLMGIISIVVVSNTDAGNSATAFIVVSANFAFFKVIVPIVCITIPTIVAIYYFKKRQKRIEATERCNSGIDPEMMDLK